MAVVVVILVVASNAMRQQAIGVKGKLLCGSNPAANVRIKLWDEDSGQYAMNSRIIYICRCVLPIMSF